MTSLEPQRSRISQIDLKGEIKLWRISRKMEQLDLFDQKSNEILFRLFIGPGARLETRKEARKPRD